MTASRSGHHLPPTARTPQLRPQHPVLERRRLAAAELFAQALPAAEVARRLHVSRQSAHRWYRHWQGRVAQDQKGARRRHAWVAFLDESGVSLTPAVRRTCRGIERIRSVWWLPYAFARRCGIYFW
jgi:Homeodomain-like domain